MNVADDSVMFVVESPVGVSQYEVDTVPVRLVFDDSRLVEIISGVLIGRSCVNVKRENRRGMR